jgi:hypothetical protein
MPYTAPITSANPTCFLFLLDRSSSMLGPVGGGGGRTKAQGVADAVNSLLCNLVLSCRKGEVIRDRLFVGVLGYGLGVGNALGGDLARDPLVSISRLAHNPLRVEQRTPPGGSTPVRFPVWIDPAGQGRTPMCRTLRDAAVIVAGFLAEHPSCFPPVVVHITDGEANDGDPEEPAARLRELAGADGNVLLFNAHLSSRAEDGILFPDSPDALPDAFAGMLFRMSSPLPPPIRASAAQAGYPVTAATRGFAFNARMDMIVQFLHMCTTTYRKIG